MPTVTRRLRHWKQRYAPNAAFIWRRRIFFGGKTYEPGERIPDELVANKAKLRRFWEGQIIELAEFETPAPARKAPETLEPLSEPLASRFLRRRSLPIPVVDVPVYVA